MGIPVSDALNEQDLKILRNVDQNLVDALQLKQWWKETNSANSYSKQFPLVRTFQRPNSGVGFFDTVTLSGKSTRIMGLVQEMLYDRADSSTPAVVTELRKQFQQFVLGYFTHVTDFREPEAYVDESNPNSAGKSSLFSWCPDPVPTRQGFGFSQLYYKLKGSGKVGKFPKEQQYAIVDLRELITTYEWIVAKVKIFNFALTVRPFGPDRPELNVPLSEETHVILSGDFLSDKTSPRNGKGSLGTYGFGYGMLKIDDQKSLLAYGPDHFDVGFQTIDFTMDASGKTSVQMVFVVNRADKLVRVPIRPMDWSFALADVFSFGLVSKVMAPVKSVLQRLLPDFGSIDPILTFVSLANAVSAGQAAEQLCISRETLDKEMLLQHFTQHYQMILSSLLTWRSIENWLDQSTLPEWVREGISA